ncbi:adenosylmethionine--8-amino-7-oxononanoate transaminase [Amnimonas aquatica]|uniref:Adenosylmethionine-8-amino-7-oxononanoate aminotransferase n=1 Tax=Amnimonas aquatica TaxID=2094561 RepID=A0A2P6ASM1_9GAMM|nr:adenosylmethionine--8-amino-7-oxononanoate transaminase [Amnimonas aquatica]PQA43120.1 adenosylmethionine--8-amino-7-oxononanoate transaminase [Amnimonas aquatica]
MTSNHDISRRDLRHVWHPCTQMHDHEQLPLVPIRRGEGIWLEDFDGRRYLDGISSWWVNLFGHAHPELNAALRQQADTLEHVILAGFTHEAIVELSERLVALAPPGLNKCFYADNGSSGIEVALKMSLHAWRNLGKPEKTRFIALENSYHGETIGALGVTDIPLFSETYRPMLRPPLRAPSPAGRQPGESLPDAAARAMAAMETLLAEHAHEVAAVIVEPLVQGAAGMRMYDASYLTLLRAACDRHGVHLIADEIAVGFGRTGTMFACEQAGISPDFLVLSKGLTAGYLPMSVVMTTDAIYDVFYDRYDTLKGFLHSHSYTGNALAARVALASLDLFARDDVIARNRELAAVMADALAPLHEHPNVLEVRQTGMIAAVELVRDKASGTPYDWRERRGLAIFQAALKRGLLLRPIGSVVYFMPPYIITPEQIRWMVATAAEAIDEGLAGAAGVASERGPEMA